MRNNQKVLVCDLDNTLYDWVSYFVPSLYALTEKAAVILGVSEDQLLDDLREVHQYHSDSEHPFALLETKSVLNRFGEENHAVAYKELNDAFYAFNQMRKRELRLFPDVKSVLAAIKLSGVRVIAHTESRFFAAADRVHRLGLTETFERIYCREEAQTKHPDSASAAEWLRRRDVKRFVKLPADDVKPDARVLMDICSAERTHAGSVVYFGDSIAKDMMMAKKAGSLAVWAKYGANHDPEMYSRLVRISHWTAADVEREKRFRLEARRVDPDFVCEKSIRELLDLFGIQAQDEQSVAHFA